MKHDMNQNKRTWLILVIVVVAIVAILAAFWAASMSGLPFFPREERRLPPPYNVPGDLEFFYTAQTVVSTVNVTLSIFLLLIYVSIYRKTRSEFTIGLMIFSTVLLLHAIVSNPFVIWVFGFRSLGLGPFVLLPDLFTFGALAVLLYLSVKY